MIFHLSMQNSLSAPATRTLQWILRLGVFGTFLGHGLFAFSQKTSWIPYLTFWGFSDSMAMQMMPVIGVIDIVVALIILIRPMRWVLIYAFAWAFSTALMRVLVGEGILEFVERAANWACPLALYLLMRLEDDVQ